jgi:ATP-dependent helicase/nuclease subunit A
VVAGSRGVNRIPPGCGYELIADGLKPEAIEEAADDGDGTVLRWRKSADAGAAEQTASAPAPQRHDVPAWLRHNAPAETALAAAISPSAGVSETAHSVGDSRGLARGRIVHRLLQALPALARERRAEAAKCWPCSATRALRGCLRPVLARKFQSSDMCRRAAIGRRYPARSIGSPSPGRRC